jgi:DtxR family Mn-dependent transcriptional regulator
MIHPEFIEQPAEEVLERIWVQRERGDEDVNHIQVNSGDDVEGLLEILEQRALVRREGDHVTLTEAGEERARRLVRRNRLAERLLSDVLNVPLAESEHAACLLEHVLSPAITDAVCTFLGHPPTCPHGFPIPPGGCCDRREHRVEPVVHSLDDEEPGVSARILFMTPGLKKRLDKLESLGVVPGTVIQLRQKRPSLVIEVGGTTLALERDVAREIFVRRET